MKLARNSAVFTAMMRLVSAHSTFPNLIVNGTATADWKYVRMTANHDTGAPLFNISSPALRCYENDYVTTAPATEIATVVAGSTVGFKANKEMLHQGYLSAYMSEAYPAANSPSAGTGSTWFKIWEWSPTYSNSTGYGQLTFDSLGITQFTFKIPENTPSGQYLLRGEQIALHGAATIGGAQFYIACAQINVINGGSGTPGPLVAFPGAYNERDPGILIYFFTLPYNYPGYTAPGPAVWSG